MPILEKRRLQKRFNLIVAMSYTNIIYIKVQKKCAD